MAITADYHVHSNFSGDSTATMEDMIEQAITLGLEQLCFTDHMDYDYPEKYCSHFEFSIPDYYKKIADLKEIYQSRINILTGVELGLKPYLKDRYETLLSFNKFDFVIGSTHLVDDIDPYYLEYWEDKTEEEGYYHYFETVLNNIKSFNLCDVYGHIDYIVRYGPNKNSNYSYDKYKDILDKIFISIIDSGKGIEVNTAGFKYGLNNPHPHIELLHKYREMGGEIITIGSDGHAPEHLAYNFNETCELLKDIGFKYYAVYQNRKPNFKKI